MTLDPTSAPAPGEEREPVLMLDVTGSMSYPSAPNSPVRRRTVIQEAISIVVAELAKEDSQAASESAEQGGEGGGLRTITWADGRARDIGDLNPGNLTRKWGAIEWGGGTYLMPGLREVQRVYRKEFGSRPADERPTLLLLVITDGEAEDTDAFVDAIGSAAGGMYIEVAIVGYGSEHDRALAAYQRAAAGNTHLRVQSFDAETDPNAIAQALLRMIA